jgi:glycerol uptake facilitator protein
MTQETPTPPLPSLPACCFAEVLGTFLLVFFGCGAVHVAVLAGALEGLWQVAIVWGVAIMVAVYAVGAVSGAHINPAITIGLAVWGGFPRGRVLPYVGSQLAGAFLAAAVLFGLFHPRIADLEKARDVVRGEPGSEITAMCYGEYFPNPGTLPKDTFPGASPRDIPPSRIPEFNRLVPEPAACLVEVLGTAILGLVVMAVTDPRNTVGPRFLGPAFIGLTVAILIVVIAPLTQACFNPARDFGPRLFASLAGWGSVALPGPRPTGFLTVYILSPILGAIAGMGVYRRLIQPHLVLSLNEKVEA